ncbi:DUF222 domain-containing protein [Microbacterium gorillae]|uniref:HNH endonuclease signature motif containing protein n=1 Tax=Microbacterium gorillae TaxID=1231063 RepID=UPI003D98459F
MRAYVDALVALSRSRAATDALEAVLLADLVTLSGASGRSSDADLMLRSFAAEVGAALRVSDRTIQRQMSDALQLVESFPAVHEALSHGEISIAHVGAILQHGLPVEEGPARDAFVERALELARVESANRLRHLLGPVAEQVRDVSITERHREARRARTVWVTDDLDGMATLHALLPSVLAHGVKDRLDQMAHALRASNKAARNAGAGTGTGAGAGAGAGAGKTFGPGARVGSGGDVWISTDTGADIEPGAASRIDTNGDADDEASINPGAGAGAGTRAGAATAGAGDAAADAGAAEFRDVRTVDQIRADILADLLLTTTPTSVDTAIGSIHATVAVTIPVLTLLEQDDTGAELDGITPIDADTARALAGNQPGLDRILTHPITGAILATDRYRPTSDMKRFLTHRDQHCRHPGCRVPIRYTDIDHNHDWANGGKTDITNLAPLCRRHHTLKTSADWKITPHPDKDGTVIFHTPAGYRHTENPPPRAVTFTPTGEHEHEHEHGSNGPGGENSGDGEPPW